MFKKLFFRLAVLVLLINGGIAWGQINLVDNGDFEAGSTGWTEWSSTGGWTTHTFGHDYGSGGTIWIPSPYPLDSATHSQQCGGELIHGGLFQVIDVSPGETYSVSGEWAGGVGNVSSSGTQTAWFEITIYDGAATVAQIDAAPVPPNDVVIAKRENNSTYPYEFNWEPFSGQFTAQSAQVTLALKTGKVGDWDYIGAYHDNIAIAPPPPIPTMTEWGMVIFTLLLTVSAFWYIRKHFHRGRLA